MALVGTDEYVHDRYHQVDMCVSVYINIYITNTGSYMLLCDRFLETSMAI